MVASGFTLIFGLMRVVNMAHGSFFLLGRLHRVRRGTRTTTSGSVGLVLACVFVAVLGVIMQQTLLRWNQGQDLRQALITIAVSVILADQMLAKYGGVPTDMTWPDWFDRKVPIGLYGIEYSFTRLFILLGRHPRSASGSGSGSRRRAPAWSSAPASTTARWSPRSASTSSASS